MKSLTLIPLDEAARDGGYHVLGDGQQLAVARWQDGGWNYSSGRPLGFVPVGYREAARG